MEKIPQILKAKRREITLILVSIMVLVLFFSGYSLGKEQSIIKFDTNAKIAEPILVVENNPAIEINGKNHKEYYDFKVKNHKENGEVTQVDLQYNIEIISKTEESISFKLYKDQQEILLENNKTSNLKLEKGKVQEDNYKLEVIYDKTKNKTNDEIMQDVQIKVHSEQLKD